MRIEWYFDFISPFACLQWPAVRALADRHDVRARPLLLAAVLDRHGQKGPAEIAAKRRFTYRFVQFQARRMGVPLRFPPAHPFNPLAALRLCIAAGGTPAVISAVFDWIWIEGRAGDSVDALRGLADRLGLADPESALAAPEVKNALRRNGEDACAAGVFGVPTAVVGEALFWGLDATAMLEAYLADPVSFNDDEMQRLDRLPVAATRIPG